MTAEKPRVDLAEYGFAGRFAAEASARPDGIPARVIAQYRGLYRLMTGDGERLGEISGKLRYMAQTASDLPAVGDFVLLERLGAEDETAPIGQVLARKSAFIRRSAGRTADGQVVAANIDRVFLCMSANNDFNLRRLERYLSIGWDSGAVPVIVLTKMDLCGDEAALCASIRPISAGADILTVSSRTEGGLAPLRAQLAAGTTAALIGSSGTGKSSIINRLLGSDVLAVNGLRDDDKGRHTTTARELFRVPGGGLIIDTPGMRELGMWDNAEGVERAFADVESLIGLCRFGDCTHTGEPGCAVRAALADGTLTEERWASYEKLLRETRFAEDAAGALRSKKLKFKKIAKQNAQNQRKK